MNKFPIDVSSSGAILLGGDVCCDGFHRECRARVQTHVHLDHMDDFETSKGYQDIYLTAPTKLLLCAEFNADLPYRDNIITVPLNESRKVNGSTIELVSSQHMLGSVQSKVTLADGRRVGYSGDFQWPLDHPIQVDAIVVDSTYGSPESRRSYSQAEVESRFLQLVSQKIRCGPVHIKAFRGTIQRALQVLCGNVNVPMIGTPKFRAEAAVYQECGYAIDPVVSTKSPEGKAIIRDGRYIRFYGKGDDLPVDGVQGTTMTLSAYMSRPDDPVLEYTDRSYRVAMSNHADFDGTLEYVRATGAKFVVADNSRGGHAIELALALRERLGIDAVPSSGEGSKEWGE